MPKPLKLFLQLRALLDFVVPAARKGNLEDLGLALYSLRHGGASGDALRKLGTMEQIHGRLRHRSTSSMRRYEKSARVQAEAAKIPARWRTFGTDVGRNLARIMGGQ